MNPLISLQQVMEQLEVDPAKLLVAIRDASVSVMLSLPREATLRVEYPPGLCMRMVPPWSESIDLAVADYACIAPEDVMRVAQKPDELVQAIQQLMVLNKMTGDIEERLVEDLLSTAASYVIGSGHADISLVMKGPHPLMEHGYLFESDVSRIADGIAYYPEYRDMGDFIPSASTTEAIKDMNMAFHLFRIHKPLDAHGDPHRVVMEWLRTRWNTPTRLPQKRGPHSPVGDNLLRKAADVVLGANSHIKIGDLCIPDAVRDHHHAAAPDSLMLMECLALWRPCQPTKPSSGELDFRSSHLLYDSLKARGVAPSKYRDLLVRVLTMDAIAG
ncbi:hypothetical protein [Halomonas sp. FME65]|uniref:hypothetical protein n=1 Tax=Halomonas sp. FME65 TaxID=2742614 RepID=UPI00186643CC|nr:hypothetical protein [Halomonas sp. FME65]